MPTDYLHVHSSKYERIEEIAVKLRQAVIEMLLEAKSGHSAGPMGAADIFAALYFNLLKLDPNHPNLEERDRFVLSCGHYCPILYTTLAYRGFFPIDELKTFRKLNSRLQGHPQAGILPGVETSSGPLGQGISQAVGMALSAKLDNAAYHVYCLGSDGELNEGQTWEAALFAGAHKLNKLTWIIDRNNIQIDGFTEDVLPLEPIREKLEAFNWYVLEVDGHNIEEIINAVRKAKAIIERPTAIIAHTIPGKDVKFMEYQFEWHGKPPSSKQAQKALHQLRTLEGRIKSEHE